MQATVPIHCALPAQGRAPTPAHLLVWTQSRLPMPGHLLLMLLGPRADRHGGVLVRCCLKKQWKTSHKLNPLHIWNTEWLKEVNQSNSVWLHEDNTLFLAWQKVLNENSYGNAAHHSTHHACTLAGVKWRISAFGKASDTGFGLWTSFKKIKKNQPEPHIISYIPSPIGPTL